METFLYALHFIVCFVLIGVVLLQRGKGADLGASLGGGGANTIFGSRGAGNFLTRITTASAIIFMGTSLTLAYLGYQRSDVNLFDDSELPAESDFPGGFLPESDLGLETLTEEAEGLAAEAERLDGAAAEEGALETAPASEAAAATLEATPEATPAEPAAE
ncbi:MAG: preprotein translocase subunit SecG [Myxococcota bacterium]